MRSRPIGWATAAAATVLAVLLPVTVAAASPGIRPPAAQQRQLALTQLQSVKVVIVATRGPDNGGAPLATVRASAYRLPGHTWTLISTKRVGRVNGWFWYPASVCTLTVTPRGPLSRAAVTLSVRLLVTPSIGCSETNVLRW